MARPIDRPSPYIHHYTGLLPDETASDRPQPEPDVTILLEGDTDDVAVTDLQRMRVDPSVTAPDAAVEVTLSRQGTRGPAFMVERLETGV